MSPLKIPKVYRSQTTIKADTGARPLTAQLSAAAMAAPGKAQAAVGEQTTNNLLEWGKKELSIRRATNVTAAQRAYESAMFEHEKVASGFDDPEKARVYLAGAAKKERARLKVLTGSFDSVTKTRVNTALSGVDSSMVARARTEARKRMVSGYIANTLDEAQKLKSEYATASSTRRAQIQDKLFGRVGGIDPVTKRKIKSVLGIYEQLENLGHYDAEQRQKAEAADRGDLAAGDVRQHLLEASQSGDSEKADKVYNSIQRGIYKGLDPDDAIKFSERAEALSQRLARQQISDANAEITRKEKARKTKHRMTESALLSKIYNYQKADAKQQKTLTLPTIETINDAFSLDKLSREGHKRVLAALEKRHDPIVVNTGLQKDMIVDIDKANTQQDLDDIRARAIKALGDRKFDIQTLTMIENRIDARKNNTPQYRQLKAFKTVLESWTKTGGILDSILPGAEQRGAQVIDQFEADVADGKEPLEAFQLAVDAFRAQPTIRHISQPRFGPSKNVSEWKLEDVEEAIKETRSKFSGKARSLASQMATLFILKRYLEAQAKTEKDTKNATQNPHLTDEEESDQRKKNAAR